MNKYEFALLLESKHGLTISAEYKGEYRFCDGECGIKDCQVKDECDNKFGRSTVPYFTVQELHQFESEHPELCL